MPPTRSRDLTYFRAYLQEKGRHPFAHRDWPWGLIAPLALIGIAGASVLLAEEMPTWIVLLFIPFALVTFITTAAKVSWGLQQPRSASEQRALDAYDNARYLSRAVAARQIHPFAARLLEGCAYHRARILSAVTRTGAEGGHLQALGDQALAAADSAMNDAMAVCAQYAGPGHSRGAAWKDLAQDFAEGQIGDALKRLQIMLEADRPGEIVDRRKLPSELWPAYDIAVKLQRLASEIEAVSREATTPQVEKRTSDLDQVLSHLAEIRAAERELEEEPHLRQF